jgi:hypothetical protein
LGEGSAEKLNVFMAFPPEVAEQALLACARYCCLCHKFCGNKIETHHIVQGGGDTFENCIPLCFDCHAEVLLSVKLFLQLD